jgi:hypothetical protein
MKTQKKPVIPRLLQAEEKRRDLAFKIAINQKGSETTQVNSIGLCL